MTLLALTDVACVRGGRLLFEGMNLTLEAGGAAVITGPNGVGKSSLIRVAAGLLRAAAGTVRREGNIALADEAAALDERLTLAETLGFWARIGGVRPEPGMEAMGLLPLARVPVHVLSAGQRQRAVLARVVASRARLWLLDEPANGLDAEGQEVLAQAMEKHRQGGGAILAASHQPLGLEDAQVVALSWPL